MKDTRLAKTQVETLLRNQVGIILKMGTPQQQQTLILFLRDLAALVRAQQKSLKP